MAERFPLIIHSAQESWNGRRRQSEGESLQRRASGSASRAKMPDPDGTLTEKRSAAMSAHVLLSEHKQTSRGHRQIDAIDP